MALYHTAIGSVSYTVVGNPTIENGIASGFSASDYIQTSQNFSDFSENWEIVIATPSFSNQGSIGGFSIGNHLTFIQRDTYFRVVWGGGHASELALYLNANFINGNTYFFKIQRDGEILRVSYSTDGMSYLGEVSTTPTGWPSTAAVFSLGAQSYQTSLGYGGTIDLNKTYIKVNGQPWFGVCPIEVQKHQLKGPVGYEVVGNPTIVDGIASNLSNSVNYLRVEQLPSVINDFEMVCRCNCGSSGEYRGNFVYSYNPSINVTQAKYYTFGASFSLSNSSTLSYWRYKPRTAANPYNEKEIRESKLPPGITIEDFVFIRLKMVPSGSEFLYSMEYSLDGENWGLLGSQTDTYQMTGDDMGVLTMCSNPNNSAGSTSFNTRAIDLNNTYIKVNGKLWFWQPRETERIVVNGVEVWKKLIQGR